jgi:hypothetical protein
MPRYEPETFGLEEPHAYNDKNLVSIEFMRAVMHDDRVPIKTRLEAAEKLAPYEFFRLMQISSDVTIGINLRIEGLPSAAGPAGA